jgi:hypothetical protein
MHIKTKYAEYAEYALKYATYAHTHTLHIDIPLFYVTVIRNTTQYALKYAKSAHTPFWYKKDVKYEKNAKICLLSLAYQQQVDLVLQNKKYA